MPSSNAVPGSGIAASAAAAMISWPLVVGWTASQNKYSLGFAQAVTPSQQGSTTFVRPYVAGLNVTSRKTPSTFNFVMLSPTRGSPLISRTHPKRPILWSEECHGKQKEVFR